MALYAAQLPPAELRPLFLVRPLLALRLRQGRVKLGLEEPVKHGIRKRSVLCRRGLGEGGLRLGCLAHREVGQGQQVVSQRMRLAVPFDRRVERRERLGVLAAAEEGRRRGRRG
jgi:hypothetical protein